ncbi:MAG TPA: phospholipid carrier-dependent glycosyltransferase [Nocardioidaceae bacterium]|nr:phospholipid carrier-dependent glycosyltransferase [Nocardioidaceae bacterium]
MSSAPSHAPDRFEALGRASDGRPLPDARRRLAPAVYLSEPVLGWIGPLAIALLAGVLRFWRLGYPNALLFDETYYAKDAFSLLRFGYVRDTVDKADELIVAGRTTGLFTDMASFYVHPDVGKWLIAFGEWLFGLDAFGWRFSAALAGTLTVLVLARLVRRLTGSTLLGCVAGLLLCLDGLHLVMSRTALLDIFLTLFLVCAVACLVADRDWGRLRLGRAAPDAPVRPTGFGPLLLWRPWRLAAGVCFGLAVATKWSALFPLAAFGLLVWAWDSSARRAIGVRLPVLKAAVVDAVPAFFALVGVALAVYVSTWAGWLVHAESYEERLGDDWGSYLRTDADGLGEVAQSVRSLWNFHQEIWAFHTGDDLRSETHVYESDPWGWLILNRPVGVDAETDIEPGTQGCPETANTCIRQILAIGTPALWWGGLLALLASLWWWIGARDWRFGLALVGVASTWLPWLRFSERPIFLFYAVAIIPFTVIATTLALGKILGPPGRSRRRLVGACVAGGFVALVAANFAFYYPIWTDGLLTHEDWLDRIWFTRWI